MARLVTQAVILCGGLGTRLRPLTYSVPKPMIGIYGKPFLEYILGELKRNGIRDVILLVGYLHNQIEDYFGSGKNIGLRIRYSLSPIEADTGTRLRNARPLLKRKFLLLYGDNYWPFDVKQLENLYIAKKKLGLVTVYRNRDGYTKNNLAVDADGLVQQYDRKRTAPGLNRVDIGFFILDKRLLSWLPKSNCSFEDSIIPRLVKEKQLVAFVTDHQYYSLSKPDRIPAIQAYFSPKKVILLDRDGVINGKPSQASYVTRWSDFHFLPGVIPALRRLRQHGYRLYIITNQPGVARGYMTEKDLVRLHGSLRSYLLRHKISLGGIYTCMHGWGEGCFCRKPNPGLLYQAAREHHFNLYDTYYIGDDVRDIEAGRRAGAKTIFLTNKIRYKYTPRPDIIARTLADAVAIILKKDV